MVVCRLEHLKTVGRGHSLNLDDVAKEEAGHVEVVDRHVAEHAAGHAEVGDGGRLRVAAGHAQGAEHADLARPNAIVDLAERGIEAPIEAEHDEWRVARDVGPTLVDPREIEVDRLLAQDLLAGEHGAAQ